MSEWDQLSVASLNGVGPALTQKLQRLGLNSVADLLFHLPLRYEDRTQITAIADLSAGQSAQIDGEVLGAEIVFGRRRSLRALLRDSAGDELHLQFFHFNRGQHTRLEQGGSVRVFGEVRYGRQGLEIVHPELRWQSTDSAPLLQKLTPVYPVTEGLGQISLRKLLQPLLRKLNEHSLPELLPPPLLRELKLPALYQALKIVHEPPADADTAALMSGTHPAIMRLVLEELIAHQLSFLQVRSQMRAQAAPALPAEKKLTSALLNALPFALTAAQQRVVKEIRRDLAQPVPMLRLLQGDVGSGKTLVAALAILTAIGAGKQAVLMAPTELLAEQHAHSFAAWFAPLGIHCTRLLGKTKGRARAEVLQNMQSGAAQLIIGTHALFQEGVEFNNLALVIVDEQHRFGVHQRLMLWQKGEQKDEQKNDRQEVLQQSIVPHQLVMTATPIPRTLAMTAYADLDTSVIDELPPGRTPVVTVVVAESRRAEVIERVQLAISEGRQCYWVCALVEESDELDAQAAQVTHELLQTQLPRARIGLVHGRLKAAEKSEVMQAFKQKQLDVLVATTVIEVGVDVPNASLMIIENAERFGLAQLHQLRGRVGRGSAHSHCVLLYHAPLSSMGRERLAVMRETQDGFVIAERDMEQRGPGELLGTRQTGVMGFRIADIARDQRLVPLAQHWAKQIMSDASGATGIGATAENAARLQRRWIGLRDDYAQV